MGAEPWNLEPPGVTALMEKLRTVGVPLREFAGVMPLRGVTTGLNQAFLVSTPVKEGLIAADLSSAPLFKPSLRGQDIDRWRVLDSGQWMIAIKSSSNHDWPWSKASNETEAEGIFAKTYPALHAHLTQHRDALIKREDQGKHWWELRACAFWDEFEKPKLWFQQIQYHPCYAGDQSGLYGNNKTTFLPTGDRYLLGVLNSPLMWWHNYRYLPHMKDEALAPVAFMIGELPIPKPTDDQRAAVEAAVGRLIELTGEQQAGGAAVLDWLRSEFGVEKPTQKLQGVAALDADTFAAEVKKAGKKGLGVADLKRLKDEHAKSVAPLRTLAREAEQLERQVSDVVNAAFGLTPDEVKLMWDTAPPRMPIARPPGQ